MGIGIRSSDLNTVPASYWSVALASALRLGFLYLFNGDKHTCLAGTLGTLEQMILARRPAEFLAQSRKVSVCSLSCWKLMSCCHSVCYLHLKLSRKENPWLIKYWYFSIYYIYVCIIYWFKKRITNSSLTFYHVFSTDFSINFKNTEYLVTIKIQNAGEFLLL